MATITNRSRYVVSVSRQIELRREFSYARLNDAKAYARELRRAGYILVISSVSKARVARASQSFPMLNFDRIEYLSG